MDRKDAIGSIIGSHITDFQRGSPCMLVKSLNHPVISVHNCLFDQSVETCVLVLLPFNLSRPESMSLNSSRVNTVYSHYTEEHDKIHTQTKYIDIVISLIVFNVDLPVCAPIYALR